MNLPGSRLGDGALSAVLVYGAPLSLKSTLAVHLAGRFHWGLVSTGFFGPVDCDQADAAFREARSVRYRALLEIARCYLNRGWSIVVEGNFSETSWRAPLLAELGALSAVLTVVRCACSDPRELLRRQAERSRNAWGMDRNARPYGVGLRPVDLPGMDQAEIPTGLSVCHYELDTGAWTKRLSWAAGPSREPDPVGQALQEWLSIGRDMCGREG